LGREELSSDLRHVISRDTIDLPHQLIQGGKRLSVEGESGQPIEPGPCGLEGYHDLPFDLLFDLLELLFAHPVLGHFVQFFPNRLYSFFGRRGPRPQVNPGNPGSGVE